MSFALTTTKRKFNKILDSISNASSTSLVAQNDRNNASTTTLSTTLESASKKRRISRPTSGAASPTSSAASRNPSVRASLRQLSPSGMNKERKAPNFAPWDRGQFLERLATFRHVDKWMGKPDKINEVQWARRGWTCVGKERVGCVGGCGREVVIKLEADREERNERDQATVEVQDQDGEALGEETNEDWRESAREQLVDKYAEMIVTEHDGGCLWRRRGCDDTIYRLPLAHQTMALDSLRIRYESLAEMASELPSRLSTPSSFDADKIAHNVPRIFQTRPVTPSTEVSLPSSDPKPLNLEALTLALFGWQAEPNHITGLATCTACFRRLGLWLFKSALTPSDGSTTESASMTRLDVVGEHRDYCPWVNGISQSGSAALRRSTSSMHGLAGWETLLRVLRNVQDSTTESERSPIPDPDGAASEAASVASSYAGPEEKASRDEKDKERWAKLKRLKRIFNVKRGNGKGISAVPRPRTAG